jgi:hypothetical protein
LHLCVSAEKRAAFDFNGAGRRRTTDAHFKPCQRLSYLGAAIDFRGALALKPLKTRQWIRNVRERVRQVSRMTQGAPLDQRIDCVCAALDSAFQASNQNALPGADFLRSRASCRADLRDLDFRVALLVAESLTATRGVRAFRDLGYKTLRRHGLSSLVTARNRRRACKASGA